MNLSVRGCQICRKRRVKCDGARPTCQRCTKAQRECSWDPNVQAGLKFKNENVFAQGKSRRPPRQPVQDHHTRRSVMSLGVPHSALTFPIEEQAFHYYIANFVLRVDDIPEFGHEYGSYVLFEWLRSKPDTSLHNALHALSHAVFGKAKQLTSALDNANKLYAQSIIKTQQEMKEPSDQAIDQLMITIMLMALYENIMFNNDPLFSGDDLPARDEVGSSFYRTTCHHEGAIGLMKLRQQLGLRLNSPMHRSVRRQIMRSCILRGAEVPDFLQDGSVYGEDGPNLSVDAFTVRTAAIRAQSLSMSSPAEGSPPSVDEYLVERLANNAAELDSALAAWPDTLPADWQYSTRLYINRPSFYEMDVYQPDTMHIYTTHSHAAVWMRYRALRLIVNSIRCRAIQYRSQHMMMNFMQPGGQVQICRRHIGNIAADICASVDFFFNRPVYGENLRSSKVITLNKYTHTTDADILPKLSWYLAWPLTIAVNVEEVPEPHKQFLIEKLKRAARSLGDAVLERVTERGDFRF